EITPHPRAVEDIEGFCSKVRCGFEKLSNHNASCPHIVIQEDKLFLKRAWTLCQEIERHFNRLQKAELQVPIDIEKAKALIEHHVSTGSLFQEQAQAVLEAIQKPLFCIWGGPGTGKTHTAGIFLKLLMETAMPLRVCFAAPTGKATNNLAKSVQRACGSKALQVDIKTLHSLLQIRQPGRSKGKETNSLLPYSLMVVDESSMIDASLCAKLLSRLADGSRLLLLGDPAQLRPVEPGCPFSSFVEQQGTASGRLHTSRRTELKAILELAALVNEGKEDEAMDFLTKHQTTPTIDGVTFRQFDESAFTFRLSEYTAALYKEFKATSSYEEQFSQLLRRQILSPLRVGAFGTQSINERMRKEAAAYAHGRSMFCFEPIVITKNDYQLSLSNGQIGLATKDDKVIFESSDPLAPHPRAIPRVLLSSYEQAYCLSVHKSQGSEFDSVLLILPPGSEAFGRKMLYTAITRARKEIEIWSTEEVIRACVRENF
ncbi:MAG: AAA family ATPase, partial [Verrucomicrobia bacterium]|nr:AAA family ATPase [Verrucomicrobiota bacterium]